MKNASRLLLAVPILVLASSPSVGYPIRPVPLWELVERAERIILADVIEERDVPPPRMNLEKAPSATILGGSGSLIRLSVRETWKGDTEGELEIAYNPNLICPAPPRYEVGKTVIAFLESTDAGWRTVGLSYGTLYPTVEEVNNYGELVKDAVRLQSAAKVAEADSVNWLVDAASRPGTRWHGLYPLQPGSDRLHSYYDPQRVPVSSESRLSHAQLKRIADGFVSSPPVDRTLPMALTVLTGYRDPEVDRAAVSALEALLARERPPWWIRDAVEGVLVRFGDSHPRRRLSPLGARFEEIDAEALRRIRRKARKKLLIPRVSPAEEPAIEVWGVGSNTPS